MKGPNAHDASIAVALAFVHGFADDPQSENESIEPDDSTAAALKSLRQAPLSRAKCLERARYAKLKKKTLRVAPSRSETNSEAQLASCAGARADQFGGAQRAAAHEGLDSDSDAVSMLVGKRAHVGERNSVSLEDAASPRHV